MSSTEIVIAPAARREIKKLCKKQQLQVISLLRTIEQGSETLSIEKIKGQPSFFRARIGNMRVIYTYISANRVVILVVRDRKKAYRGLSDLDQKLCTALHEIGEEMGKRSGKSI